MKIFYYLKKKEVLMLDLKFYSEITSNYAKNMFKSVSYSADRYYGEKYEVLRCLELKFKIAKIYYSKSLENFIIMFETKRDEKDVYLTLAELKNGYNNLELDLNINYENILTQFTLKIDYSKKLLTV